MDRTIPDDVLDHVRAIIDYSWAAEDRDYREHGFEEGHIFESLRTVDDWLAETDNERRRA